MLVVNAEDEPGTKSDFAAGGGKAGDASDEAGRLARLEQLLLEALNRLRQLADENAILHGQVAGLERQARLLLVERAELTAQVAVLERQVAYLRVQVPDTTASLHTLTGELLALGLDRPTPPEPAVVPPPDDLPAHSSFSYSASFASTPPGGPDDRTGASYTVIAAPFTDFGELQRFQLAVQSLSGTRHVRVRRFGQRTLELQLDYTGEASLSEALLSLPFALEIVSTGQAGRLQLRLLPGARAAKSGE